MKSEYTVPKTIPAKLKFPLLARCEENNAIVLFKTEVNGTVLSAGDGTAHYTAGYNGVFVPIFENSVWKILPEGSTVTLTQESIHAN